MEEETHVSHGGLTPSRRRFMGFHIPHACRLAIVLVARARGNPGDFYSSIRALGKLVARARFCTEVTAVLWRMLVPLPSSSLPQLCMGATSPPLLPLPLYYSSCAGCLSSSADQVGALGC